MGYSKFDKNFKSSLFKDSTNIVFKTNNLWDSLRFYFKKTKSIRSIDVINNNDFNGYNKEPRQMYKYNLENNLLLK